jgi:23S rRNA pseudouridine955/2504/2580 synthase
MKKIYFVKDDFADSRLDRWFRRNVSDVPQSLIEKNIRKGNIKVNNKKKLSSHKLQTKDQITIFNLKIIVNKNKKKTTPYKASKKDLQFSSNLFIENNENFVVINKPSGISVQSGTKSRRNILDILRDTPEFNGSTPFSVHRIDKETTGLLIVAKNRKYAQLFTSLFRIRKINKIYLGIVLGELEKIKGIFKEDLYHMEKNEEIRTKAITRYKVIDSNKIYSLIELIPETGRKHQLRKHLLMHGNPILGDTKYRLSNKHLPKKSTLMLHAYKVNFSINDTKYTFSVKPPESFNNFLKEKYLKNF